MPQKYKKKPVVIEAHQWTGDNFEEIDEHTGGKAFFLRGELVVHTLEGVMTASIGDYIVKGVCGEFYPCKANIFELTYEQVDE